MCHLVANRDIAMLFGYETKNLNRQVIRNINRFPENYCFQLTEKEYHSLRCQNVTLKSGRGEHRKYMPYAFTEYSVTMLAGILKSDVAVEASIKIVNAFIEMRKFISNELIENKYYKSMIIEHEQKLIEHDNKFDELFNRFNTTEFKEQIFFEGNIYDAYSKIIDIMHLAKEELIVIDNYADKKVLDMISNLKVKVYLITKESNLLKKLDIEKYHEQYNNLEIIYSNKFHDRFLIIDKKEVYHLGSSINYAGKKIFAINKLEEQEIKESLIKKVDKIIEI